MDQRNMLHILLMIARKIITINWMQPSPPRKAQWIQKVKQVHTMENMTAILQLKVPLFIKKMDPCHFGPKFKIIILIYCVICNDL